MRGITVYPFRVIGAIALGMMMTAGLALAGEPLSDAQVREAIIRESVAAYLATGHPCAYPCNAARNGSSCGRRSAYTRPGGASPLCYPKDVSDDMVANWRRAHP